MTEVARNPSCCGEAVLCPCCTRPFVGLYVSFGGVQDSDCEGCGGADGTYFLPAPTPSASDLCDSVQSFPLQLFSCPVMNMVLDWGISCAPEGDGYRLNFDVNCGIGGVPYCFALHRDVFVDSIPADCGLLAGVMEVVANVPSHCDGTGVSGSMAIVWAD